MVFEPSGKERLEAEIFQDEGKIAILDRLLQVLEVADKGSRDFGEPELIRTSIKLRKVTRDVNNEQSKLDRLQKSIQQMQSTQKSQKERIDALRREVERKDG